MKTNAASIIANNNLFVAQHALECAIMSIGGFKDDGSSSRLFDERPMGWKAARRTNPGVVPPIERNQWAREARTFLGAFATMPVPGDLTGEQLIATAEAGVRYAELVVKHGSADAVEIADAI